MVKFLGRSQAKELCVIASQVKQGENCRQNQVFSSLNSNDNINLYFYLEHMNLRNRTRICCYQMIHIYSVLVLHLQIDKYKGSLIKIKVFDRFFSQIKGFKGFQQN